MNYITGKTSFGVMAPSAVSLGKFDGLHRGHQKLLQHILEQKKNGLEATIFTFASNPTRMLSGVSAQNILTNEERREMLAKAGVDNLLECPFVPEIAHMEPERFIEEVLVGQLKMKFAAVGTDFHFGKNRSGSILDLENLEEECGYHLIVVEKLQLDGKDISSTRIRASLEKGDMEEASALLGRNYSVSGEIVHGNALGRTIQVPTINQKVPSFKLLPPNGVYVSKIHWNDEVYYGITNIGTKPTVNDTNEKTVETNIFDFDKDVYGEKMVVELLHYHRKESRFSSVEALQTQLFKDIEFGKQFVAKIR